MSIRGSAVVAFAALALAGLAAPGHAAAFSATPRYAQPADEGGGGGRFFTGSSADGFTCDVCHSGPDAQAELTVAGLPVDGYEPGKTYPLRITWDTDEQFALVAEFLRNDGDPSGTVALEPDPMQVPQQALCDSGTPATRLHEDVPGRQVVALTPCGATRVEFEWTAPEFDAEDCQPDAGLYVAAVVGDESDDPEGDAVILYSDKLPPADVESNCVMPQTNGCSVTRVHDSDPSFVFLFIVGVFSMRRRIGGEA